MALCRQLLHLDGADLEFRDLGHGVVGGGGHGARAKSRGQTDHAGAMSESGAVVDVVGAGGGPDKFLHEVVLYLFGSLSIKHEPRLCGKIYVSYEQMSKILGPVKN